MQKERNSASVETVNVVAPIPSSDTEMHTMKTYKRVKVEKVSPASDSTFLSCIVSGGHVLPLRKRHSMETEIPIQSTQLLSTPMKDLIIEADELKLQQGLSNQVRSVPEHPVAYGRDGMIDLWVDKYSPQAFPQVSNIDFS